MIDDEENILVPSDDAPVSDNGASEGPSVVRPRGFDILVARYFEAKSREALQDEDMTLSEASEAVARNLMTTPAELSRQVMVKINIFEAELTAEYADGAWLDHRILPMFAALKAELIRFGIGRSNEEHA